MLKSSPKILLKVLLVAGLFWILAEKGFLSFDATRKAILEFRFTLPALALLLTGTFLGILRWHLLLKGQGIFLPFRRTAELGFVGMFFNIALPGAVSGDVVKAIYVGREVEGKRAAALGSILFDRVAGSSALILVSGAGIALSIGAPWATNLVKSILFIVIPMSLGIVGFYFYLFFMNQSRDPLLKLFGVIERRFSSFASVIRIYEGIKAYGRDKTLVLKVLTVSFLIHVLVTASFILFARAFGESQISILAAMIVVPLALLVTAIPVLPGGIGTGHAAFLALFALVGSKRGADIFNLFVLFQFFIGAVGGLVFLRFKGAKFASAVADARESTHPQTSSLSN